MGKFKAYLAIEDVFIRDAIIELLEGLKVVRAIKPLYFIHKLKDISSGSLIVLIVGSGRAEKNIGLITELNRQFPECIRSVLLITRNENYPEQDNNRIKFDYVVSGTDFSKIEQIFGQLKDEWTSIASSKAFKPLKTKIPGGFEDDYFDSFTNIERKIIKLICQGLTSKQIADKLCRGKSTIEKYRYNLLAKTGTKNTAGLVKFAIETGIHRIS